MDEDDEVTKLVTIQERQGSIRTALKFRRLDEETIDEGREIEKLRKKGPKQKKKKPN